MSKLGIVVFGSTLDELLRVMQGAEAAGLDAGFTTDFYTRSASISLAAVAMSTSELTIGSAIMYAVGRSPLVLATEARDINELSNGRLVLGLGTGTRTMQRDWHGIDPSAPAVRMEELVPLLRRIWSMGPEGVQHDGRFYHMDLRPTAELRPPVEIPVYMGGVGARMIAAVGAVADGHFGHPLFTARYVEEVVRPAIEQGATRAGRTTDAVTRCGYVICAISEDGETARREAKAQIAFYSVVKAYDAILAMHGLSDAADEMRAAWARRDTEAMIDAVPDRMVELMALAGTPAEVRERYDAHVSGIHDDVLLYPPSFGLDPGRYSENIDAILETFSRAGAQRATP